MEREFKTLFKINDFDSLTDLAHKTLKENQRNIDARKYLTKVLFAQKNYKGVLEHLTKLKEEIKNFLDSVKKEEPLDFFSAMKDFFPNDKMTGKKKKNKNSKTFCDNGEIQNTDIYKKLLRVFDETNHLMKIVLEIINFQSSFESSSHEVKKISESWYEDRIKLQMKESHQYFSHQNNNDSDEGDENSENDEDETIKNKEDSTKSKVELYMESSKDSVFIIGNKHFEGRSIYTDFGVSNWSNSVLHRYPTAQIHKNNRIYLSKDVFNFFPPNVSDAIGNTYDYHSNEGIS